jgi:catechol 2,3-dioxygenase-like lactoylglutathione lyase family enzyme
MTAMLFDQQVTFIYTRDLASGSAFLGEKLGLELALNQNDTCHIYKVTPASYLGICINREPPEIPGVTYSFVTSDVDGTYETLRGRGVEFEAPPAYSERFKVYSAFFRGPENYRFEIQEFRDPAWRPSSQIRERS